MRLGELEVSEVQRLLCGGGLSISVPPFVFRLKSKLPQVCRSLRLAYCHFSVADSTSFVDFELEVFPVSGIGRWLRPVVALDIDGGQPFDPLPAAQAFPLLEWGMNWCITTTAHNFVMCHSAVLAWNDMAVVLPAPPGSGKSTLCAALTMSGWRLLSDELALLDPDGMWLYPHVRPVSLKNASIALIGGRYPDMQLTEAINDTLKGTVAHMRPPENAVRFATQRATPRWLVFPRYRSGCELTLSSIPKAEALTELASNSFNFSQLGVRAFSALAKLVDDVDCYRFEYSSLDGAIKAFEDLARRTHRPLN